MSLVLEKAPELFTAYLHCSSRWDGDYAPVVENRLPVYLVIGESDEYYSSKPTREAYDALRELYLEQGLSETEIDSLPLYVRGSRFLYSVARCLFWRSLYL